ncbi:hypothetical protein HY383_01760 [Candidatus Daviesbacteria bacterium]|nr:hypothetical protein [Candidatus Daviesbacteria bacterium]
MQERELFDRLNKDWNQPGLPGSDTIRLYFPYDHTHKRQRGNVTSVLAITTPPSVYDTRLRVVIVNPITNMVHIVFEDDHGENGMASYNYREVRVVLSQTNNRIIVL